MNDKQSNFNLCFVNKALPSWYYLFVRWFISLIFSKTVFFFSFSWHFDDACWSLCTAVFSIIMKNWNSRKKLIFSKKVDFQKSWNSYPVASLHLWQKSHECNPSTKNLTLQTHSGSNVPNQLQTSAVDMLWNHHLKCIKCSKKIIVCRK